MDMSTDSLAVSGTVGPIASRTPQRAAIILIGVVVAAVIAGYIIIGIRSMQSQGVIDARLRAVAGKLQTRILSGTPSLDPIRYEARVREAVQHPPHLLSVQFVQVDMLNTAVTPPTNVLVANPARHRAVLVDGPFLAQVTHTGKPAATTVQSGTDSLRVYVTRLRSPRGVPWVGVIEVFEKVDGTAPSM